MEFLLLSSSSKDIVVGLDGCDLYGINCMSQSMKIQYIIRIVRIGNKSPKLEKKEERAKKTKKNERVSRRAKKINNKERVSKREKKKEEDDTDVEKKKINWRGEEEEKRQRVMGGRRKRRMGKDKFGNELNRFLFHSY
jgi:hypothetical protein